MARESQYFVQAGAEIRSRREFKGLVRKQLAKQIGLSVAQLKRIENGQLRHASAGFNRAVDKLNIDLADLDRASGGPHGNEIVARSIHYFDEFIADRLRGFVGRTFVFEALRSFEQEAPSGYFLITGPPGIGKSALMARLVKGHGKQEPVFVHHFNIAQEGICTRRILLENVCARLISKYRLPYDRLPEGFDQSGNVLKELLTAASRTLGPKEVLLVAIDALDEIERATSATSLFLPAHLPDRVYFVLTGRNAEEAPIQAWNVKHFMIESGGAGNTKDVAQFVASTSSRPEIISWRKQRNLSEEEFIAHLVKMSEGNFMYLRHVLPEIEGGRYNTGAVEELPHGLRSYYRCHWQQMQREDQDLFMRCYEPVVCCLAAANESVNVDEVAGWTQLSRHEVLRVLRDWRTFLHVTRRPGKPMLYRIYHSAFRDFLREEVDPDLEQSSTKIVDAIVSQGRSRRKARARPK